MGQNLFLCQSATNIFLFPLSFFFLPLQFPSFKLTQNLMKFSPGLFLVVAVFQLSFFSFYFWWFGSIVSSEKTKNKNKY